MSVLTDDGPMLKLCWLCVISVNILEYLMALCKSAKVHSLETTVSKEKI